MILTTDTFDSSLIKLGNTGMVCYGDRIQQYGERSLAVPLKRVWNDGQTFDYPSLGLVIFFNVVDCPKTRPTK